jgi:hypothetical protein
VRGLAWSAATVPLTPLLVPRCFAPTDWRQRHRQLCSVQLVGTKVEHQERSACATVAGPRVQRCGAEGRSTTLAGGRQGRVDGLRQGDPPSRRADIAAKRRHFFNANEFGGRRGQARRTVGTRR